MNPTPAPEPVIVTDTEPARMSPTTRVVRTLVQVVIAVCVAIPSAAALLNLSAETTAKVTGIAGAVVVLVSAAHNAANASADRRRDVDAARHPAGH